MIWRRDPNGMAADYPQTNGRLLASAAATLATWHAIANNGMAPVLASCATTLAFSLWSPGLGQAAFCGSFAGMSTAGTFQSTLLAGALTAGLFEVIVHREDRWLGLGGRLGVIAFLGTNLSNMFYGTASHGLLWSSVPRSFAAWKAVFYQSRWQYAMLCGALGSVATIALREIAEDAKNVDNDMKDPIRAATAIGVVSSLLVGVCGWLDNFGSLLIFGGALVGKSLPSRLLKGVVPGKSGLKRSLPSALEIVLWYGAAGALGGLVHAMTVPLHWWTGGVWGGKTGTCAFVGVLLFRFLEKIVYLIRDILGLTSGSEDLMDSIEN